MSSLKSEEIFRPQPCDGRSTGCSSQAAQVPTDFIFWFFGFLTFSLLGFSAARCPLPASPLATPGWQLWFPESASAGRTGTRAVPARRPNFSLILLRLSLNPTTASNLPPPKPVEESPQRARFNLPTRAIRPASLPDSINPVCREWNSSLLYTTVRP
ncbi:hypothetical protein IWX49DRAFT_551446 [Phyllosticta citricarpa]